MSEPGSEPGEEVPSAFRRAVEALTEARPRSEVQLTPIPPPKRLAPFGYALQASVAVDGGKGEAEELADGRFILLHDPGGQQGWHGTVRAVTLARAEVEPEIGDDPLVAEVAWSWLAEALESHGAVWQEPGGTVTLASSQSFGSLAERQPRTEVEMRASWTLPVDDDPAEHLLGWCAMLGQCAGLPPEPTVPGVAALPRRRSPRRSDPYLG